MRVSIVVPHLGNNSDFEDTLISVLENRPSDADVWVVHDGNYSDPFDLGDEVRFVTAPSRDLPTLVAAATDAVPGRIIHLLGPGTLATEGWVSAALEKFEHAEAATVSPVIVNPATNLITAAGWADSLTNVQTPIASGRHGLGRREAAAIRGVYLTASFWRRGELRSAMGGFPTTDAIAAQYAWSSLLRQAGWRCVLADQSVVRAASDKLVQGPSWHRGRVLRSLSTALQHPSGLSIATAVSVHAFTKLLSPRAWPEVLGHAAAVVNPSPIVDSLNASEVRRSDETLAPVSIAFPTTGRDSTSYRGARRAA